MKLAISASAKGLDAQIDPRFGRCAYFIIVDTEDMKFEAFDNENIALGGGAGIQSAQFVASKGAKVVLTGNVGPNAVRTLSAAGLEVITGQSGTVREAIENYKQGGLKGTSEPTVSDHYGMSGAGGSGALPGGGIGMGRGGGGRCGMGRGMGKGMGSYSSSPSNPSESDPISTTEDELNRLKEQAHELQKHIDAIESRMKNPE